MNPNGYDRFIFDINHNNLFGQMLNDDYPSWKAESTAEEPTDNITTKEPRAGYIDGGVVLTKGITITREFMEECSMDEWNHIDKWTASMQNIVVEEVLDRRLLWVYNTTPCITSMAA